MRLTSTLTLVLASTLLACGPGGGSETGTETGTATGTSTGASTSGSTSEPTTSPVTTGPATTGPATTGPATTTGEPATSTGEPVTSTTGEPVTSTGEPGTTTGNTSGGPGSSSDTSTGEPTFEACLGDEDCALHNDCCDCYGVPVGQVDPSCALQCEEALCDQLGVQAICRFGVCTTEKLDCDGSKVLCKSLPPVCLDGWLPGVINNCWSGSCSPIRNCNAVPTCDLCPADTMCVQKISKQKSWPACEPIPAGCGGEIDCECAGAAVCTDGFTACNDLDGNQLSCGCPAC